MANGNGEVWEIRKRNFADEIYFYAPGLKRYQTTEFENSENPRFVGVSITGSACQLNCEHCHRKILETMYPAGEPQAFYELAERLYKRGVKGILVTGGSDSNGVVPLLEFCPVLGRVKEEFGFKIVVHTGLVEGSLAHGLAEAGVDAVMTDVIGSDETIREIYHLDACVRDFHRSISLLADANLNLSPHIVIGIHYGRIMGEIRALELLSAFRLASLVLVVLNPWIAEMSPPSTPEIGKVFELARGVFPKTPILLGCARPEGKGKREIDELAVRVGLNGIAYPAEGIVGLSRELGLKPEFRQECCSLIFEEFNTPLAGWQAGRS